MAAFGFFSIWLLQQVEGPMELECKRFIGVTTWKVKGRGAGASRESLQTAGLMLVKEENQGSPEKQNK